jgi:hypothetical protein
MLAEGEPPTGQVGMRILMTRMTRELAREYRQRYGATLTVDATGIEAMQQHLLRRMAEVQLDEPTGAPLESDLTRHGAFLSEILARRLGAEWLEPKDSDPTEWAMRVANGERVWPMWRVHHFLRQRWQGRGALLSFYEELQTRLAAT